MRVTHAVRISVLLGIATAVVGCTPTPQETAANAPASSTVATKEMPKTDSGMSAMDHGAHSGMNHAMGDSGMNALRSKTGKEFDIAFLSQMIAHHEAAVTMAKQALGAASMPGTKTEAQNVVDSQSKEIAQMTGWLKSWYGAAPDKAAQALVNADMRGMMAMPITTDAMFYQMMIPHHQGAIDMSELALENAGRAEVKDLARKIIAAQKAEIATYRSMEKQNGPTR